MTSAKRLYELQVCRRCGHWFYSLAGQQLYCSTCRDVQDVERNVSIGKESARRWAEKAGRA